MWRGLIAALIVPVAAASLAAVPAGPIDLVVADTTPGTINIDDDRIVATSGAQSGNPIWAIPLKELSVTRDRPIFSPSRRLLVVAVATAPDEPPFQPAKSAEPERPLLSLVGTIASNREGFGIFLDRSANTVLRLKTGEEHKGWILREVRSRETVLEKGDKTATLALPVQPRSSPGRSIADEKNLTRSRR
jgi:hypothetical protein